MTPFPATSDQPWRDIGRVRPPLRTLLLALLLGAVATAHAQPGADYVIGPQDVLVVQVFDQPDLGGKYTVDTDGTFSFPMLGRVTAGGKTLRTFETELRKQLANGYFKDPQVTVAVEQYRSQRVYVMGEVRSPGPVSLTGDMTLIEALARAGSTLPSAAGEVAIVRTRRAADGAGPPAAGDDTVILRARLRDFQDGVMTQNVELRDGDTIFVARAESAYVFGEVRSPGVYTIQQNTTVLQALSLAGGVTDNGAMNRIRIIRSVNGEKQEMKVKLSDVVRPGDTVIVPQKYF